MIYTIGLDPGARSPAHVLVEPLLASNTPLSIATADAAEYRVFVEGQHVPRRRGPGRVSIQSVMTLSFYAGLHAGPYVAAGCEVWVLPIEVWRRAVLPGVEAAGRLDKTVVHNLLRAQTPAVVRRWGADYVDAYWIGRAGEKIVTDHRTKSELARLKVKRVRWLKVR